MGNTFSSAFASYPDEAENCRTPQGVSRRQYSLDKMSDMLLDDPRSPSLSVDRTPIHAVGTVLPPQSLHCDPRSPTMGVLRTPIVMADKYEESSSSEDGIACQLVADPRSPSDGIARTPIGVLQQQQSLPATLCSQSYGDIPKCQLDECDETVLVIEKAMIEQCRLMTAAAEGDVDVVQEVQGQVKEEMLSTPQAAADAETSVFKTPESTASGATPIVARTAAMSAPETLGGNAENMCPGGATRRRHLAASSTAMEAETVAKPTRTLLSLRTVDMNSPRVLVQQKQIQKAGLPKRTVAPTSRKSSSPQQQQSTSSPQHLGQGKENIGY